MAERIEAGVLYPAFREDATHQLVDQMNANGVKTMTITVLATRKVMVSFKSEAGTDYEVVGPTTAQAIYDACCVNEDESRRKGMH